MKHTARTAQRTVLIALGSAAILVVAVIAERVVFERAQGDALLQLLDAEEAASEILRADQRSTMTAQMAAATGEPRWQKLYKANLPVLEKALGRADNAETVESGRRLIELEAAALQALKDGDVRGARRLLDSGLYRHHKRVLADSIGRTLDATFDEIRTKLFYLQQRTEIALPVIILICGFGAYLLWYRLKGSMARLQKAFVRAERTIRRMAMNDALTNLANRRALFARLKEALGHARREGSKVALFLIDLDRFKPINDRNGHLVGDLVLREIAGRLTELLPRAEVLARYGGDEFVVAMTLMNDDDVARIGHDIIGTIGRPMSFDGLQLQIGATIGSAIFPKDATTDEELIRKADLALRQAKQQARGIVMSYDTAIEIDADAYAQLRSELRMAISAGSLTPYFQPLVDLRTGKPRGFEILCRWQHPQRGLLQPSEFIPLAEQTGLINDLTMSLLRTACAQAEALPDDATLAINIAPQQIQDASLVQGVLAVLGETRFPPQRLEVELTENALVLDLPAAKRVITSLKEFGVRVALDDFGTGYSSLYYLSELPIDTIKIDRTFVRTMHESEENAKIVIAMLGLAKSLKLTSIAEGVESQRDADFLKAQGCALAQGNYFGMPMPIEDATALIRNKCDLVA